MTLKRTSWPRSADATGWAALLASGRIASCPPGCVVAALRALLTHPDQRLVDGLASHLSDVILRRLRRMIGRHHANEGEDAIMEAHDALMAAICDPTSVDGAELIANFDPRVRFRAVDAVRVDSRYHHRHPLFTLDDDGEPMVPGTTTTASSIAVDHALILISDPRKRLAFRLSMEGMRVGCGDPCVASVLGVNPKTAANWIAEARATLAAHLTKGA